MKISYYISKYGYQHRKVLDEHGINDFLSNTSNSGNKNRPIIKLANIDGSKVVCDANAIKLQLVKGGNMLSYIYAGDDWEPGAFNVRNVSVTADANTALLKWNDPDNTVGVPYNRFWKGTKVVRKAGSIPASVTDGTLVVDNIVKNQYSTTAYRDEGLDWNTTYYYRFFPYTTADLTLTGAYGDFMAELVQIAQPSQSGSITYNGSSKTPSWSNYDNSKMDIVTGSSTTSATNAGTYNVYFVPKTGYCWPDGSTGQKLSQWKIEKAAGAATLSVASVSLKKYTTNSATVTVSGATGTVSVKSNNTQMATASLSGSTVTITIGTSGGSTSVTVSIAESTNYAATTKTISVSATIPTFGSFSDPNTDIQAMVEAFYAGDIKLTDYWSVGDTRDINISDISSYGECYSQPAQSAKMQILGFEHDTLTTAYKGHTKAAVSIQLKDALSTLSHAGFYSSDLSDADMKNTSGWEGSDRRYWCNNQFKAALGTTISSMIKPVNKTSGVAISSGTFYEIVSTSDSCFLLSIRELTGALPSEGGSVYSLYSAGTPSCRLKCKNGTSVRVAYYSRTYSRNSGGRILYIISSTGSGTIGSENQLYGIIPGFCF